jgi:hypothetical protein
MPEIEKNNLKLDETVPLPKRIPVAIVLAILLQAATALWWASAKERDAFFLEQRVSGLESSASRATETQSQILERLARIEERLNAQILLLDRIDKRARFAP